MNFFSLVCILKLLSKGLIRNGDSNGSGARGTRARAGICDLMALRENKRGILKITPNALLDAAGEYSRGNYFLRVSTCARMNFNADNCRCRPRF